MEGRCQARGRLAATLFIPAGSACGCYVAFCTLLNHLPTAEPTHLPRFPPPCLLSTMQVEQLSASLDGERSKAASALSERATTAGELYSIREQHGAELLAERQHYERLLEVGLGCGWAGWGAGWRDAGLMPACLFSC